VNIRDLKYLTAVAKYKNFAQAAKACFVSQPALSMQVKKIETELDVLIFERANKGVMTTPVGEKIIECAQQVIQIELEIKSIAKNALNPFSCELKLGAFPTLSPYYLPKIVPHISHEFKDLTLLLVEDKTETLITKLKDGDIDCALLANPIHEKEFESKEVFTDDFLLAVPSSHHLAKKKEVCYKDLKDECLLLLKDGHCLRDQALEVCALTGSCTRQDFQATSLETLRQMVGAGVGITLIPKIAVQKNKNIVYIPFSRPVPSRTISFVWRKTSVRRECILEIYRNLLSLK
jgi:LysR family hydrogen peroxide-inducible transcriptional activator